MFEKYKRNRVTKLLNLYGIPVVDEFSEPKMFVRMDGEISMLIRDALKFGEFRTKPVPGMLIPFNLNNLQEYENAAKLSVSLQEFSRKFNAKLPESYLEKLHKMKFELNRSGIGSGLIQV